MVRFGRASDVADGSVQMSRQNESDISRQRESPEPFDSGGSLSPKIGDFRDDERATLFRTTLLGLRPAVLASPAVIEREVGVADLLIPRRRSRRARLAPFSPTRSDR